MFHRVSVGTNTSRMANPEIAGLGIEIADPNPVPTNHTGNPWGLQTPPPIARPNPVLTNHHPYGLSARSLTAVCLNLEHHLWQRTTGYAVYPHIALPYNAQVADIGVGTSLWALDALTRNPGFEIQGFYKNLTMSSPPAWQPNHLTFNQWQFFETDPPIELQRTFDLVHVRSLAPVSLDQDKALLILRLKSLLKEGGWLQWEEFDLPSTCVNRAVPNLHCPTLEHIADRTRSDEHGGLVTMLPVLLNSWGFTNTQVIRYEDALALRKMSSDLHILGIEANAVDQSRRGQTDKASTAFRVVERAQLESQRGAAICLSRLCYIAQAPYDLLP